MFSRLMPINNHLYWLITTYTGPPLSLPPISLQKEFCNLQQKLKVNLFTQDKSLTESNNLFNSLLQRAFKGQL